MDKTVILKLGQGSLKVGFPNIIAQIWVKEQTIPTQLSASLPRAPRLGELYHKWSLLYHKLTSHLGWRHPDFEFEEDETIHVSDQDFLILSKQIKIALNNWLNEPGFSKINQGLRTRLKQEEEIRIIFEADQEIIRRLPWHLWNFFEHYTKAQVALSFVEYEQISYPYVANKPLKSLAILGNSEGINVEEDRQLLSDLFGNNITFLVEPSRGYLDYYLWSNFGWDIIFFAGHADKKHELFPGHLYINKTEKINLEQLRNGLKNSLSKGLKLVILNCCYSLDVAESLTDLNIPQMIVMRESIADKAAHEFLKNFLIAFKEGKPFYLAVREAQEKLEGIESQYPGASWLPVILQNPTAMMPSFAEFASDSKITPRRSWLNKLSHGGLIALAITGLVMGSRSLGWLQNWELQSLDHLLVRMPPDLPDNRLLIIGVDEEDVSQDRYGYPLPDRVLTELLVQLEQYEPAAIGIDILRDRPIPADDLEGHARLNEQITANPTTIAICAGNEFENSIAPLKDIPLNQVGFVDLYYDPDYTVRRYLLTYSPNPISIPSRCQTSYSFAWLLAYHYLQSKQIPVQVVENNWQFGATQIKRLNEGGGSFQNLDTRGNQILIRYRNTAQIAQQVTVRDILEKTPKFDPSWVKDRIVIIGVTASSIPDRHSTARGKIQGLFIHAHVVSQLLSIAEGESRFALRWLPLWGEIIWVGFWSVSGVVVGLLFKIPTFKLTGLLLLMLIIYGVCWLGLTKGIWLSLVPGQLAILGSGTVMIVSGQKFD